MERLSISDHSDDHVLPRPPGTRKCPWNSQCVTRSSLRAMNLSHQGDPRAQARPAQGRKERPPAVYAVRTAALTSLSELKANSQSCPLRSVLGFVELVIL